MKLKWKRGKRNNRYNFQHSQLMIMTIVRKILSQMKRLCQEGNRMNANNLNNLIKLHMIPKQLHSTNSSEKSKKVMLLASFRLSLQTNRRKLIILKLEVFLDNERAFLSKIWTMKISNNRKLHHLGIAVTELAKNLFKIPVCHMSLVLPYPS